MEAWEYIIAETVLEESRKRETQKRQKKNNNGGTDQEGSWIVGLVTLSILGLIIIRFVI